MLSAEAATLGSPGEFSGAPAWFDVSELTFDALVKSENGGTAVMRYGGRNQFEMSVFAFPGDASVSFKEYSANPMGKPKRSFDAPLQTTAARAAAAKILRAVQAKHPIAGKDKAVLDAMLALLFPGQSYDKFSSGQIQKMEEELIGRKLIPVAMKAGRGDGRRQDGARTEEVVRGPFRGVVGPMMISPSGEKTARIEVFYRGTAYPDPMKLAQAVIENNEQQPFRAFMKELAALADRHVEGAGQMFLEDMGWALMDGLAVTAPKSKALGEFSSAPSWLDVSKLRFSGLIKSETGRIAVLRYGRRIEFEMSVFAFPGDASVSFKEYPADPMGEPKQLDASLQTAASRAAAMNILRAVQVKQSVAGEYKAVLDAILAQLSILVHDGKPHGLADQVAAKGPTSGVAGTLLNRLSFGKDVTEEQRTALQSAVRARAPRMKAFLAELGFATGELRSLRLHVVSAQEAAGGGGRLRYDVNVYSRELNSGHPVRSFTAVVDAKTNALELEHDGARGRTRDNKIAFDFTSLDPTSRYFLGTHPFQIKSLGQVIEMTIFRNEESYLVRYENGKEVEVLKDGLKAPTWSALRGLREMLIIQLESNAIRDPLYARMLDEIQATLAPAYVPGSHDPLWRYLWKFKYRSVDPTVAYYAGYRTDTVATSRDGIEMVLRKEGASEIILTWRAGTGFKVERGGGFVFSPNESDLRGMQLSLMREMLEDGSRERLALTLLGKLQDAVGD